MLPAVTLHQTAFYQLNCVAICYMQKDYIGADGRLHFLFNGAVKIQTETQ
jgi:hypothetical protein